MKTNYPLARRSSKKTYIHINQHRLRDNHKNGTNDPIVTVMQSGRKNRYGNAVVIHGPSKVVYNEEKPLSCGARCWIETNAEISIEGEAASEERETKMNFVLTVEYDPNAENPGETDSWDWNVIPFKHNFNCTSIENYYPVSEDSIGLKKVLESGEAFWLKYIDHGPEVEWTIDDDIQDDGEYDGETFREPCGILFADVKGGGEFPSLYKDRKESAEKFLKEYTRWANNDCYWVSLKDEHGEQLESWNWIGSEYCEEILKEIVSEFEEGDRVIVEGDAAHVLIGSSKDLLPAKEVHFNGWQIEEVNMR